MKLFEISNLKQLEIDDKERIIALGFFDGIHLAHQEIIEGVVKSSKLKNKVATLITFDKNPKEYFTNKKIPLLTPNNLKVELLEQYGIEELYILQFNEQLRMLSKENFVEKVLLTLNAVEIFCGYDYSFGYKGEGTPEFIEKYTNKKIAVNKINEKLLDNKTISSTLIKKYVVEGNFKKYFLYTNRFYCLKGIVIKGRQLGRTINFPTANLLITDNFVLPEKKGVYLTVLKVKNEYYKGITNIGNNPTVSNGNEIFIETHILNFDMDIYNENIEIYFYDFIRLERKFNDIIELKFQLEKDKIFAEKNKINFNNMII